MSAMDKIKNAVENTVGEVKEKVEKTINELKK